MTRAVMQQALEALENAQGNYGDYWMDTIAALRNALAKQEAESHLQAVADFGQLQEREPVAWQWLDTATFRKKIPPTGESECWNPLYASPPKRQPLTDEEINDISDDYKSQYNHGGTTFDEFDAFGFARAIEAKLKEKNTCNT